MLWLLGVSLLNFFFSKAFTDPIVFPSDMAAGLIGDGNFRKETIPAERVGSAEDMGGSILYLTSRAGAYCNGNVIVIDGGRLSLMPGTY